MSFPVREKVTHVHAYVSLFHSDVQEPFPVISLEVLLDMQELLKLRYEVFTFLWRWNLSDPKLFTGRRLGVPSGHIHPSRHFEQKYGNASIIELK